MIQNPASSGINLLVALARTAHAQSGIHVHVMTCHIQTDQTLEDDGPSWPSRAQEHKQACSCATVRHHVKHCAEGCGLAEVSRRIPIQGIQQTRDTVQKGACTRMKRHVVERSDGKDDSRISLKRQNIRDTTQNQYVYDQNLPIRLGANRKTFSLGCCFGDGDGDGDALFFFEGVFTAPLPFGDGTSLSSD